MFKLPNADVSVMLWEDVEPQLIGADPKARWFNTSCCMAGPIVVVPVPFQHLAYFVCPICTKLLGGIGLAKSAKIPDPKFLRCSWHQSLFAIMLPGSDKIPHIRFLTDRAFEVVSHEEEVVWLAPVSTESELKAWKRELGKSEAR